MKKYTTFIIFVFLSIFLVTACSFPFGEKKPEPFEEGTLIASNYFNFQAKIKFTVPVGWNSELGEDAQESAKDSVEQADFDTDKMVFSGMDFKCGNPNTGSNLSISYAPLPKSYDFDEAVDDTIEFVIVSAKEMDLTFEATDSFTETIAGRECRVEVLETTFQGVQIREYACFCEIDSYIAMIIIVPNDFFDATETFDNIIANFSAIE